MSTLPTSSRAGAGAGVGSPTEADALMESGKLSAGGETLSASCEEVGKASSADSLPCAEGPSMLANS